MSPKAKLHMILLGCTPKARVTEQHDVFFGIGTSLPDLVPAMNAFWPDSNGLHIDAWREVTKVGNFNISVVQKDENSTPQARDNTLFFINLGGYKDSEFEEFHYKFLCVAKDLSSAQKIAKQTAFYQYANVSAPGGASHIDDKYGFDVDDVYPVEDLLSDDLKTRYYIKIQKSESANEDKLHIGYVKFSKISKLS
jgi:hypothetical protein